VKATARRKVPGGKRLSVRLEHDGLRVTKAELSGDFFLFPDDAIEVLEASLIGIPLRVDVRELSDIIASVMEHGGISAIGFAPRDLAEVVKEALG
jgi:lipoate-protein ligase A